jgi:hypothetical protein
VNLTFPTTHAAVLEQFKTHLRAIPRKSGQKVVAVIDSIVSNPGCMLPWEKMVAICKEEKVWSVVDAAHSIGQQVSIDLGKSEPDFWVSVRDSCVHFTSWMLNSISIHVELPQMVVRKARMCGHVCS